MIAAIQQDKVALNAAVIISPQLADTDTVVVLGKIYLETFANPNIAFNYFKQLPKTYNQEVSTLITAATSNNAERAYQFGCIFQENQLFKTACSYYLIAIKQKNHQALNALITLANSGNCNAQYTLGACYYHHNGNINQAIHYCMLAVEQNHQEARDYLSITPFSNDELFNIANAYDKGIGVAKNLDLALTFYKKSCAIGHLAAAYRLGQLYDPINNSKKTANLVSTQKDLIKAFDYYFISLEQHHDSALPAVMKLIKRAQNKSSTLMKDFVQKALGSLNEIAKKDSKLAYKVGHYYEENHQLINAYSYYRMALIINQSDAIKAVKRLAKIGDKNAQFILATDYYHRNNQLDKSIYWCMQSATQQHSKAVNYLSDTLFSAAQYFKLAQCYEQGLDVLINQDFAIHFYRKAYALNHLEATYRLGQLHDSHHATPDLSLTQPTLLDEQKACDYYVIAANQQQVASLEALKKMAEHTHKSDILLQIAQTLILPSASDVVILALERLKKLADSGDEKITLSLHNLVAHHSDCAYQLAKLYENDINCAHHYQKACFYYTIAIQQEKRISQQKQFQSHLDTLLSSDNLTADELTDLGLLYFHDHQGMIKNPMQALLCFKHGHDKGAKKACYYLGLIYEQQQTIDKHWLLALGYFHQAEHQEPGIEKSKLSALLIANQLTLAQLKHLALCYQEGIDGLTKDSCLSIIVYQKLMQLNDASAAFSLGQLYQIEQNTFVNAKTLAFEAYLKAAQLGHLAALEPLEQLGQHLGAKHQQQLSQFHYSHQFFINKTKGIYWAEQAQSVKGFDFKR